jgi:hypothetical protein
MKRLLVFVALAFWVWISPANSEILVFKNGQKIETNYRWDVPPDKIGFFYEGKEYRANKADIDWAKTKQLNEVKKKEIQSNQVVEVSAESTEEFTRQVEKNLRTLWQIRRVLLDNGSLRITTAIRSLQAQAYNDMLAQICRDLKAYPDIAKTLNEVVFLSKWETQGWVFTSPVRFNEILKAPPGEQEAVIAEYTQKYKSN